MNHYVVHTKHIILYINYTSIKKKKAMFYLVSFLKGISD